MKFLVTFLILTQLNIALSYEVDSEETHKKYDVQLKSGKKDDIRYYEAQMSKIFDAPIEEVKNSIVNFEEKCNNDYADKRKIQNKNVKCEYHNPSLVESVVIKDINQQTLSPNEVERYLVNRLVYNTNSYNHSDLVQVFNSSQDKLVITHTMLETDDAKKYSDKAYEKDSAFNHSKGTFTLTALSPNKTKLDYIYQSHTDHWVLNKSVSVSKVFNSMAESFNYLYQSIKTGISKKSPQRVTSSEK